MSERFLLAGGAVAAFLLPLAAAAQNVPALEQRLRQIEPLRRAALAAVAHADSARREAFDTITAASLAVVARPSDAERIRQAATVAWTRLDSLYGDAAAELAATPLLFSVQDKPIHDNRLEIARLQRVMAPSNATAADVAFQLVRAGSAAIRARTDTALANWLGPQLLADAALPSLRSHVYVELVTAPSVAVRRCYGGALDACRAALGLVSGDPIVAWYDATERRALVRQLQDIPQMGLRPTIRTCLLTDADDACLQVLRAVQISPPLSHDARQVLVRLAEATGGRGAFRRLSLSTGLPLARRLEVAGGAPLDSLVQQWRDQIIAARPKPVTFSAAIGWTALGWTIIFGLIAMRSTRWR